MPYLVLELLVQLLQLLKLCQLLGVLLQGGLQLGLLGAFPVNLTRGFGLGTFTGWDVSQTPTSWNISHG